MTFIIDSIYIYMYIFTGQKSNSNTVWFNFQTYIYIDYIYWNNENKIYQFVKKHIPEINTNDEKNNESEWTSNKTKLGLLAAIFF
jgi:hypothetical protein